MHSGDFIVRIARMFTAFIDLTVMVLAGTDSDGTIMIHTLAITNTFLTAPNKRLNPPTIRE